MCVHGTVCDVNHVYRSIKDKKQRYSTPSSQTNVVGGIYREMRTPQWVPLASTTTTTGIGMLSPSSCKYTNEEVKIVNSTVSIDKPEESDFMNVNHSINGSSSYQYISSNHIGNIINSSNMNNIDNSGSIGMDNTNIVGTRLVNSNTSNNIMNTLSSSNLVVSNMNNDMIHRDDYLHRYERV